MAKTATVYGYAGAERWRYTIEYRDKRLADLHGDRTNETAKATLHAWLIINGFTHYRHGPNGGRRTCDNLK
jgi:hypothetical protein